MSVSDYAAIFFGVLFVTFGGVQLRRDFISWRLRRCLGLLRSSECPKCHGILGPDIARSVGQRKMRFFGARNRRLRGRDYPPRLLSVQCPGCAAKLEFRLDGSLWACDCIVVPT